MSSNYKLRHIKLILNIEPPTFLFDSFDSGLNEDLNMLYSMSIPIQKPIPYQAFGFDYLSFVFCMTMSEVLSKSFRAETICENEAGARDCRCCLRAAVLFFLEGNTLSRYDEPIKYH